MGSRSSSLKQYNGKCHQRKARIRNAKMNEKMQEKTNKARWEEWRITKYKQWVV